DAGLAAGWMDGRMFDRSILVPFCYQSAASGIHDLAQHEIFWYKRTFECPETFPGKRVFLHFGAVDYEATVWVNGVQEGSHLGGHVPFHMDITRCLQAGENTLAVRVVDRFECVQPRGKQAWLPEPDRCWYTATSGIWQTVWLEATGPVSLERIRFTPDIDHRRVAVEIELDRFESGLTAELRIGFQGKPVLDLRSDIASRIFTLTLDLPATDRMTDIHYWSPEHPWLYDADIVLSADGWVVDHVGSYFGMRKISVQGDLVLLNNRPYVQKLVLDQGYWPDTLLTPPSDEAIRLDIEMTKKLGFNGARKHQKIEDPRYYYWADRLGLLVWGEMPGGYAFHTREMENLVREWTDFINRDYNHPCIVAWVPLNESWGVREIYANRSQQAFARSLYHLTKGLDTTRLVSTNDGWEQVESDLCAIHDYVAEGTEFTRRYEDLEAVLRGDAQGRMLYCEGVSYAGQPILMTEYGGIAFARDATSGQWGYFGAVSDEEAFFARYGGITGAIRSMPWIRGYCYTQLTDVMQEVNGLLTADRRPKVDMDRVREINR
ncbi:MAG TPA: sugar-binding domain-containing protein, partial [Clostridia bacterium]